MKIVVEELRKAFARGENIMELLQAHCPDLERSDIIEIAYEMQAGSYVENARREPSRLIKYAEEMSKHIKGYLFEGESILDCGAGELTTLSALSYELPLECQLLACDISLSRLKVGIGYAKENAMRCDLVDKLKVFAADMSQIPLASNSVDVIITSHALEPNHGSELSLLKEMVRVAQNYLLLFEPSWENGDDAVRKRMKKYGYIRDLPRHIHDAGGELIDVKAVKNPGNDLNPTYCYIVKVGQKEIPRSEAMLTYHCPRSGCKLIKKQGYWWSHEGGWAYPEIEGIACLRERNAILMSQT